MDSSIDLNGGDLAGADLRGADLRGADLSHAYLWGAILSGAVFLYEAYALRSRVRKDEADLKPMKLFHWSISYLAILFLAVGIDPFLS